MKSILHSELQDRAKIYLRNKGYWICGLEVPMPVGICDAWGMKVYDNNECMAIEVKVSRGDFRSKSQKYKEVSTFNLGNFQYILCPSNLIQSYEVHEQWGLLWWNGKTIINKKKAIKLNMTAQEKLDVLVYFLNNGANINRPIFPNLLDIPVIQNNLTQSLL